LPETPSWYNLSSTQQDELVPLLPTPGTWRVMPGAELPSVFPPTLRTKIASALVIATPTSTGGTYLVFSAHRLDRPRSEIDIQPFALIVHSTGPAASGVYVQHGSWDGRTRRPPAAFWDEVSSSGIGSYFLTEPPTGVREGTLAQLPKGDQGAFDAAVRYIRSRIDGPAL